MTRELLTPLEQGGREIVRDWGQGRCTDDYKNAALEYLADARERLAEEAGR